MKNKLYNLIHNYKNSFEIFFLSNINFSFSQENVQNISPNVKFPVLTLQYL